MSGTTKAARLVKFRNLFGQIRDELLDHFVDVGMPHDVVEWYRKNLDYNLPGGKSTRGMFIIDAIEILSGHPLNEEEYFRAAVLGWCGELYQAFCLIADDIMDDAIARRGKPCWYLNKGVGIRAVNDSFMLHAAIYRLLKSHFRSEPYYVDIVDLFHETLYFTGMGQMVDLITSSDVVNLEGFSPEKSKLISTYKTAHSYYLPVALALYVTGIPSSYPVPNPTGGTESVRPYDVAKSILIPLGEYFQIQDDFLDFAGSAEVIGKAGSDIVDNKCSWCITNALRLANTEQQKILDENYGRKNRDCEIRVKEVFEQVGLRQVFAEYEEKFVKMIREEINGIIEVEGGLKRAVFEAFLDKIYGRSK